MFTAYPRHRKSAPLGCSASLLGAIIAIENGTNHVKERSTRCEELRIKHMRNYIGKEAIDKQMAGPRPKDSVLAHPIVEKNPIIRN